LTVTISYRQHIRFEVCFKVDMNMCCKWSSENFANY